jgi:hypothetical protein
LLCRGTSHHLFAQHGDLKDVRRISDDISWQAASASHGSRQRASEPAFPSRYAEDIVASAGSVFW